VGGVGFQKKCSTMGWGCSSVTQKEDIGVKTVVGMGEVVGFACGVHVIHGGAWLECLSLFGVAGMGQK